jgi:outer membrane protein insertion porin family
VPVEGGVKLVIAIEERPLLRSIDYQGLDKLSRSDVADQVDRERIEVRGRAAQAGELVRLRGAIEELYERAGYRFAEVRYEVEEIGTGERRVVVTVDEGDRCASATSQFEGNQVFGTGRLRDQIEEDQEDGPDHPHPQARHLQPGDRRGGPRAARKLYRDVGYKNVRPESRSSR